MQGQTIGIKLKTVQKFTQDGVRIPVTYLQVDSVEGFKPGDLVKVTGCSKGKGFTGVVKRWGFKGGPKTHGQSDRQRSPGSIGQGTTPGRVYKGKKMAGRSGGLKVTISGLTLMDIEMKEKLFLIKGLIPGAKKGKISLIKYKENKKFVPLMKLGETEIKETEEEKIERLRKEDELKENLEEANEAKTEEIVSEEKAKEVVEKEENNVKN
ncbi:MAG: 50S ribosomal protein L3 [Candidatus Shapirobacteria bacterium]|nr:50S ribosomal protein L3 [Candidatus Shapirobacteria bacterium]